MTDNVIIFRRAAEPDEHEPLPIPPLPVTDIMRQLEIERAAEATEYDRTMMTVAILALVGLVVIGAAAFISLLVELPR